MTILAGDKVFHLMDTHGVPLVVINDILREKGLAFNVVEFIEAALRSGNYTFEKIKARLLEDINEKDRFMAELDRVAMKKGWQ